MAINPDKKIWPDVAIPPGSLLKETIGEVGMTQEELANRTGHSEKMISQIINAKAPITDQTAFQLERVLGTPAHVWINLESAYQYNTSRLSIIEESQKLKLRPIREAIRRGWIKKINDRAEQTREILSYLRVSSFENLPDVQASAFRKSHIREASPVGLAIWLRKGEIEAEKIQTSPFSKAELKKCLGPIRALTLRRYPGCVDSLRKLCASCGLAVVIIPHLPNTYVNGATYWLSPDKAVIQLSLRYKKDDQFWFSFFHEIGHILLHRKGQGFIDYQDMEGELEGEADRFAADIFVTPQKLRKFAGTNYFTKSSIESFAKEAGISPGIVVGRLQREGKISWKSPLNKVKIAYQ